jgi:DNA-binding transcriptional MerR regulator
MMSIGDVARTVGLSVPALRYYERLGLLERPARTSGGLRRYTASVLERLQFIEQAKALRLSLADIRELLELQGGRGGCRNVLATLDRQLAEIDRQVETLVTIRRSLEQHRAACVRALESSTQPSCPTLGALAHSCSLKPASGR